MTKANCDYFDAKNCLEKECDSCETPTRLDNLSKEIKVWNIVADVEDNYFNDNNVYEK